MTKSIAILGFGAGGRYLAAAIASPERHIQASDPMVEDAKLDPALGARAAELGVTLHGAPGPWLRDADIVVSLVPGSVAEAVAAAAAETLRPGSLFLDLNSITGEMMARVAESFRGKDISVVDGGVLGNFEAGNPVPVLLVGENAERAAALLPASHFKVQIAPGKPGDASAIKMLRSVLMKGLEALCVECFVAAEAQGVRPLLMRAFDDLGDRPFVTTMEVLTMTHLLHAQRRMGEVERVQSVLAKEGVRDLMTEATRQLFLNTVEAKVRPAGGETLPIEESLEILRRIYATTPA